MQLGRYTPSSDDDIRAAFAAAKLHARERFLDVGSGDGRVVKAALKKQALATGIEIDDELVRKTREIGLPIEGGDAMEADWSDYDVIYAYHPGFESVIEAKFAAERTAGARLVLVEATGIRVVE